MGKVHQEVTFDATPEQVYKAFTDSSVHAAFTRAPADLGSKVGDAWSAYGGKITGRQLELVEGARIVQSWRAGNWAPGVHSILRLELSAVGKGTKVVMDHDALAEDQVKHIGDGWETMYWAPLRAFFAK